MGNRIWFLFFAIAALSLCFSVGARLCLRVRVKKNVAVRAVVWILLFVFTIVPIFLPCRLFSLRFYTDSSGTVRTEVRIAGAEEPAREFTLTRQAKKALETFVLLVLTLWFVALAASLSFGISNYWNTLRFLTKNSANCRDPRVLALFAAAKKKAGVHRPTALRVMHPELHVSPCTAGTWSPSVFIGGDYLKDYSDERLTLIFMHELTHVKHSDGWLRLFTLLATSFHALLPVSSRVRAAVSEDTEYLCDRTVLRRMGEETRGEYVAVILDIAERNVTGDFSAYDLFSPASSRAGEVLLERYERMRRPPASGAKAGMAGAVLLALGLNLLLFALLRAENPDNLRVDFHNPMLCDALTRYFSLDDPRELTEAHLVEVWRIDFRRESAEPGEPPAALCDCVINEERGEGDCSDVRYPVGEDGLLDLSDLALFSNLRTLVMDGGLRPEKEDYNPEGKIAVILRD